ncbi:DNA cytosine methyltransferase [Knoellia sp. Soil729]|uniref:DNA cytosine methyltransferase n=1 Tax=Knoellia sp. Soil729 TaxID=1736394 RepID=UPI0006FDD054|nr:DNA cytosine methyltransferase [Knoellia sp. Soil729]KRE41117.1 hypothetical protein ASG74_14755 [Knoellia sp. Soil729]
MLPVVDVFAGPGGLNEGFAQFKRDGEPVFDITASFEMDRHAVQTLKIRSAVRALSRDTELYGPYRDLLASKTSVRDLLGNAEFAAQMAKAEDHVHAIELGPEARAEAGRLIKGAISGAEHWVLIGGPPCQAYSLIGRARRTNDESFEDDKKHFLYREYLDILRRFRPSVFVMENVKGLLSAGHGGKSMMDRIIDDLQLGGAYEIRSLAVPGGDVEPRDFVLRAERYGIPQARHRVILVGVRSDIGTQRLVPLAQTASVTTVRDAIGDLPQVKSSVSRRRPGGLTWGSAQILGSTLAKREVHGVPRLPATDGTAHAELRTWLNGCSAPISLHEPRAHMDLDLARYAYLAILAARGISRRVHEFPPGLRPMHSNISGQGTPFSDRFKVQRWDAPSSTVASHISKDGHYYIHPDARQMRSLTVREAARLQTFPDDYWFAGPRTMQYHQVGNAVPPLLAVQIAERVAAVLDR